MSEHQDGKDNQVKPAKKKLSNVGFSQKAKPRRGKSGNAELTATPPRKKPGALSSTGFSQKAKPKKKGYYTQTAEEPKKEGGIKKKANSDIGFSQKAKPVKKGYYTQTEEKPTSKKKAISETGFSQKARPKKNGYYTQDKPTKTSRNSNKEVPVGERPVIRRRNRQRDSDGIATDSPFLKKHKLQQEEPAKEDPKPRKNSRFVKNEAQPQPVPEYNLEKFEKKYQRKPRKKAAEEEQVVEELIRLNRYIANSGICSRRDADLLIEAGEIKVNGKVVTELGYKVKPTDIVKYGSKVLNRAKMVYVHLNKPKDFITTTDDPNERKTVMDLVRSACPQRIYPVGRLDRNTTGLLLLTNDGELAEKLTHPSHKIKKLYEVELDKPITEAHFQAILNGLELEDGRAEVDEMATVSPDKRTLGIQIHIGRNRIVRRIFEHLSYEVIRLDRVMYANLTKKDLPRGNWRFLTEKEVITLKYLI
jgi:23S rRNA pseudouridine2605 synthase